jgi:hypothetical protein
VGVARVPLGVPVVVAVAVGVTVDVAVAVGVAVGVAVVVGVAVGVGVAVTVGVGVGEPDCAQYLPPVRKKSIEARPPQTIISRPVHTAV